MNHILRIFGILPLVAIVAASFSSANAMQIQLNTGAPYLCIAAEGGNTTPGTPVIVTSCSGGPEDQWQVYYGVYIEGIGTVDGASFTGDGNSTCLYVADGGNLVVLNSCQTEWYIQGNGTIDTFNAGADEEYCLDSSGGPSVGGGTQLMVNPCTGAASQNWILRAMQLEVGNAPQVVKAPYRCANVEGNKTADGTPVITYSCDDGPNELWNWVNGQIQGIGTENGTAKCLTASGTAVGSLVEMSTCNGSSQQQWATEDYGEIVLNDIQYCLDNAGPAAGGGTQLVINYCMVLVSQFSTQFWMVR
jgi:beta-glucosidase